MQLSFESRVRLRQSHTTSGSFSRDPIAANHHMSLSSNTAQTRPQDNSRASIRSAKRMCVIGSPQLCLYIIPFRIRHQIITQSLRKLGSPLATRQSIHTSHNLKQSETISSFRNSYCDSHSGKCLKWRHCVCG